jgi:hypothetical protein
MLPAPSEVVNPALVQAVTPAAVLLLHVTDDAPTVMVMKADASACGAHTSASTIPAVSAINVFVILDPPYLDSSGFARRYCILERPFVSTNLTVFANAGYPIRNPLKNRCLLSNSPVRVAQV